MVRILNPNPTPEELQEAKKLLDPKNLEQLSQAVGPLKGEPPLAEQETRIDFCPKPVLSSSENSSSVLALQDQQMTWFTLGAVYFILKIDFDLVSAFAQSRNLLDTDIGRRLVTLPKPLLPDIPGWEFALESIRKEYWDSFTAFLGECGFYKKNDPVKVWHLYGTSFLIGVPGVDSLPIYVFSPQGSIGVTPFVEGDSVRFYASQLSRTDERFAQVGSKL